MLIDDLCELRWTHNIMQLIMHTLHAVYYLEADLCADYMCVHVKSAFLQKISGNFVYYVTVHS